MRQKELASFVYDPIGNWLYHNWPIETKGRRAFFVALFLGIVTNVMVGIGIGYLYATDVSIIQMTDYRELFATLWGVIVNIPTIWAIYIWQTNGIKTSLMKLSAIQIPNTEAKNEDFIQKYHALLKDRGTLHTLLFFLAILATFYFVYLYLQISQPSLPILWWEVWLPYTFIIWIPFLYLSVYMAVWILIRHFYLIKIITEVIESGKIRLSFFHPDNANGLDFIRSYFFGFSSFLFILGVWMCIMALFLSFFSNGYKLNEYSLIILGICLYLGVPIPFLFYPLWNIEQKIQHLRNEKLEEISREIDILLNASEHANLKDDLEKVELLQKKFTKISEGYATSNLGLSKLLSYVSLYILPIVTSMLPFLQILWDRLFKQPT
jgi:hypothetical protein